VVQDIEVTAYLQALGMRLVSGSPDNQLKFNFFVVQDNSINAFAMPGGVVGVHTGLILASNSESELASVLGHEIGHVTQHHLARMLAAQKGDTFKNIAGMALAILVARANPQLASGALTTASAVGVQSQLDYTREHEREADRIGLQILDSGGFDVRAMPAMFLKESPFCAANMRARWCCVTWPISWPKTLANSDSLLEAKINPVCTPTTPPGMAKALMELSCTTKKLNLSWLSGLPDTRRMPKACK
jgi:predicted Zn-dependent protease